MRHLALFASLLLATATHADTPFTLGSPDLAPGQTIPATHVFNGFGCSGENHSPALQWSGLPEGTQSLALTVYDPDAPTGSGWWHWVVINLPADLEALPRGAGLASGEELPSGSRQIGTDFGTLGYGGPCPPPGDPAHRYIFTLHALSVESLALPDNATAALAGYMINANRIASATFTAHYGR